MLTARARLVFPLLAAMPQSTAKRRNLLLIAVDDLNTDLGCYGHALVRSPHVDRLARRGVRFERAYCQYPVCNPSRTSFLSGRYPEQTGVLDNTTDPRVKWKGAFLPEYLRSRGYFTARVGKIYHDGMDGGSDWDVSLDPRPERNGIGSKGEGRNLTEGKFAFFRWMAAEGTDEDQPDGLIAQGAIKLLEEKRDGKPFFLAVGLRKPHDPYVAPKNYFDLYPTDLMRRAESPPDDENDIPTAAYPPVRHNLGPQEAREYRRAYYSCISFMDAQLGKILAALDRSGEAANTTVIFFGDHGLHLGEHGWWNKVTLFERSARVPCIVAGPDVAEQGRACRRVVELIDVYPSVCESLREPAPAGLMGRSFLPLLKDAETAWPKTAYTVVSRGKKLGRCLHTERYRYTEWDEGRDGAELYDHDGDLHEYNNLVKDPQYAPVVKLLREALQRKTRSL